MTESWEEKTERLEREYQARIDSLKHSCERAVSDFHTIKAYSEETESQLRKRVAWLEGVVESKEKLQAWLEKTLTEANSRITNLTIDFQSQLEAKDKRVAELERCMQEVGLLAFMQDATPGDITAHMTRVMDSYVQRIAELQSQLEAKGKRVAELDAMNATLAAKLSGLELRLTRRVSELKSQLAWTPVSKGLPTEPGVYEVLWNGNEITGPFSSDEIAAFPESMRALWTNYRRVELPKDGET